MISPITGQQVPVEQMAEHMRIALLDPKWKEKSGLVKAGEKEDTLAQGDDVGRSLAKMAAKRKDIFGTDEEVFGDNKADTAAPPPSKVATSQTLSCLFCALSLHPSLLCVFAVDDRRRFIFLFRDDVHACIRCRMGQQIHFFFSCDVLFSCDVYQVVWDGSAETRQATREAAKQSAVSLSVRALSRKR